MDDRKKNILNRKFDPKNESPWIQENTYHMPDEMRKDLLSDLGTLPGKKTNVSRTLRIMARTAAAACLLALISYSWEQACSLKKLNELENRLAQDTVVHYSGLDQLNRVLVLNSLVDWDKLKKMDPEKAKKQYADVLPAWFNANLLGDQYLKIRLDNHIRTLKINTKIK